MTVRMLTVYVRDGCHLCVDMVRELEPWKRWLGFSVRIVDVSEHWEFQERFGGRVPVLVDGGQEICCHFLDEDALTDHFAGA